MKIESDKITLLVDVYELDVIRRGLDAVYEQGIWPHIKDKSTLTQEDIALERKITAKADSMLPLIRDRIFVEWRKSAH